MKTIIYYFSGTGNSLNAARLIAEELGETKLVPIRKPFHICDEDTAGSLGFVFPVYEWDVPKAVREFIELVDVKPETYCFAIATFIAIHGGCFETVDGILQKKGARLHYAATVRCVASQCIAYEPFPPERIMVPLSDRKAKSIAKDIAENKEKRYPRMSPLARKLFPVMMTPFLNVQHEYDKGFYTNDACIGCGICQKVCPCGNLKIQGGRPVWLHSCEGCNACVVYCPQKAIQFKTPEAYKALNNAVSRRLGLPEKRKRYHNPHISAADMMGNEKDSATELSGQD